MEWILDNFAKLLPVILAVLYFWLNAKKRRPEGEEAEESDGSDETERASRIQEEIRRRILERQRGDSSGPHVEPPVLVEESLHQPQERQARSSERGDLQEAAPDPYEIDQPYEVPQPQTNYQEVLERQARLAERLEEARRRAEARKPSGKDRAASTRRKEARAPRVERVVNPLRAALLSDLKDGVGLKRAILLREVLGEPVGFRRGPQPQK